MMFKPDTNNSIHEVFTLTYTYLTSTIITMPYNVVFSKSNISEYNIVSINSFRIKVHGLIIMRLNLLTKYGTVADML